nr:DUF6174 domain-containing protein [uncultured Nocardioides sp.]
MNATDRADLKLLARGVVSGLSAAIAIILVIAVRAALSPSADAKRAYDEAHALWEAHEPSAYSFDYHDCGGMCGECRVHVTVRNDAVVKVTTRPRSCGDYTTATAPTIDGMFAIAAQHHETMGIDDVVDVTYDSLLGYPHAISVICGFEASDCGSGWSVSNFEPRDHRS